MSWQVQEAKQRFSELIRRALAEGPQVVTRHGEEVVVIVPADEYRKSQAGRTNLAEFLLAGPDFEPLDLERGRTLPRATNL